MFSNEHNKNKLLLFFGHLRPPISRISRQIIGGNIRYKWKTYYIRSKVKQNIGRVILDEESKLRNDQMKK